MLLHEVLRIAQRRVEQLDVLAAHAVLEEPGIGREALGQPLERLPRRARLATLDLAHVLLRETPGRELGLAQPRGAAERTNACSQHPTVSRDGSLLRGHARMFARLYAGRARTARSHRPPRRSATRPRPGSRIEDVPRRRTRRRPAGSPSRSEAEEEREGRLAARRPRAALRPGDEADSAARVATLPAERMGTRKIAPADAPHARGPVGSAQPSDSASPARTRPPYVGACRRCPDPRPSTGRARRRGRPSGDRRAGRRRRRGAHDRASRPPRGAPAPRSRPRRGARPARPRRTQRPRPGPRSRRQRARFRRGACAQREASGRAGASRSGAIRSGGFGVRPERSPGALGDCGERLRVAHGDVGERLAVELDPGLACTPAHESVVGEAVLARRGVDADDPERAERALARLAVAVRIDERVLDLLLREAIVDFLRP